MNSGRWRHRIVMVAVASALGLMTAEIGYRAVKIWRDDGVFYLASPSVHVRLHESYGWISHANFRVERSDACYGDATVTYNAEGFRGPPLAEAADADVVVCVLGDSTMHGYQITDGQTFSHQLTRALSEHYRKPFVLPLAVGGYGTLQQWMLYEDYCRPLEPDLVLHHWAHNDPRNNSYRAERYSAGADNNGMPRPYWEGGTTVVRRPYPISLWDGFDTLLLVRRLNLGLLRATGHSHPQREMYLEDGWQVADYFLGRLAEEENPPLALVSEDETRAAALYERHGYRVVRHAPIGDAHRCLPRDSHLTAAGHRLLLEAALPSILAQLNQGVARTDGHAPFGGSVPGGQ